MKKLLKIFLPPFIGFLVFSVAINRNAFGIMQKLDETGLSEIKNLTNFYRFTLPLLYVIAVLTQLLVINPVWRMLRRKTAADRVNLVVDLFFICLTFSLGIAYAIWDRATGTQKLIGITEFFLSVQAVYWFVNLLIMYLID
ncbi:MAG: hypothetical protein V4577_00155 [Bacteroidota bacterium]